MMRSLWVALWAVPALAVLGSMCIVGAYIGLPRKYYDWAGRTWSRVILWSAGTPVRVIGLDNIDRERPQIIASNHQSMFDVFAIAANLPVPYHFVAKVELRAIPLFGRAAKAAGHVFVDRENRNSAIESLKVAGRKLRDEDSTAVTFPEGTRSLTGDFQPFKKGPFVMAIESGVPIIPTVVVGTRDILPKRGVRIRPHPITLWFGEPIPTRGFGHEDRDALKVRVHAQMASVLAELRAPEGYEGPRRLTGDAAGTAAREEAESEAGMATDG